MINRSSKVELQSLLGVHDMKQNCIFFLQYILQYEKYRKFCQIHVVHFSCTATQLLLFFIVDSTVKCGKRWSGIWKKNTFLNKLYIWTCVLQLCYLYVIYHFQLSCELVVKNENLSQSFPSASTSKVLVAYVWPYFWVPCLHIAYPAI